MVNGPVRRIKMQLQSKGEDRKMVSRETIFAESLQYVRRIAREQGNRISEEQVREAFFEMELNDAQLQMVYDYLEKHNVGIGEPADPNAGLTQEERNYLRNYLDGLEALPVRSDGEKRAYTISAMAGDRMAAQRLTESYLKDVTDIARLYSGQGILLEDLIGEGNMALTMGVELLVTGTAAAAGMLAGKEASFGADCRADRKEPAGLWERPDTDKSAGTEEVPGGADFAPDPSRAEGMLIRYSMDAMEALIRENVRTEKEDREVVDSVNKVADRAKELAEIFRRKVTPEELMRETGISLKTIQDAMRMSGYQIEDIAYAEDNL